MSGIRKCSVCLLLVVLGVGTSAEGKTVQELEKAGDLRGLVAAHFNDSDERVRQSAGMALKNTFGNVPEPR